MESLHPIKFARLVRRSLLGLSACALVAAGCVATPRGQTVPLTSANSPPTLVERDHATKLNSALAAAALHTAAATADYRLAPEDLLEITLFNVPEAEAGVTPRKTEARVSQEGTITLPLLGEVPAAGLTPSALEQSLRGRYDRYLRNPQVGMFFVAGAVRKPGSSPLTHAYPLPQALAVAGGADIVLANMDELAIFRHRDGAEADKIAVNLNEILAGKAQDPLIAPDDVIIVSMSTAKWLLQRFIGTIGLPSIPNR